MSKVMREALKRHAEGVIAARNDPTGEGTPTVKDLATASKLRWLLEMADMHLLDYLIVERRITSLQERENL
jgi:DNA repair protein RadC